MIEKKIRGEGDRGGVGRGDERFQSADRNRGGKSNCGNITSFFFSNLTTCGKSSLGEGECGKNIWESLILATFDEQRTKLGAKVDDTVSLYLQKGLQLTVQLCLF